jgi:hypothetical protein
VKSETKEDSSENKKSKADEVAKPETKDQSKDKESTPK